MFSLCLVSVRQHVGTNVEQRLQHDGSFSWQTQCRCDRHHDC